MGLDVFQYSYMSDNYGVLIHSGATGETASVDAGDARALLDALQQQEWNLTHLLITHHHGDHTAGLKQVKQETGCTVLGPIERSARIEGLDRNLDDGDRFEFGGEEVRVMFTPGHTTDMINYYFPQSNLLFTGDTLFALGCGRVFEGTMEMMWNSLSKFRGMPGETQVYCGHEYTLANANFAVSVDPGNDALLARVEAVKALRDKGQPTVPSLLSEEFATNPFLRPDDPAIRAHLDMAEASDAEVFAEIRRRKDSF